MPHAGHAMPASPACDVTFTGNQFPRLEVVNVGTDLDNLSDKLMADRHGHWDRFAGPVVPVEDMNVCTANSSAQNADQHIVDAKGRFGNILQPEAWLCLGFD